MYVLPVFSILSNRLAASLATVFLAAHIGG